MSADATQVEDAQISDDSTDDAPEADTPTDDAPVEAAPDSSAAESEAEQDESVADEAADDEAPDDETESEEDPGGQVAFDINDFPGGLPGAIEAVLMVVEEPVSAVDLAAALEQPVDDVEATILALEATYAEQNRGFTLRRVGTGWRVYSRAEYAPVVEKFLLDGQRAKLSQASLETLAVIAYRQPISRSRVSAVRGVNVDGVVRTLLTRGLITETGQDETSGATLYATTDYFLERMGLATLDELPALAPFLPDADALDELTEGGQW